MWPFGIVDMDVVVDSVPQFQPVFVGVQVYVIVLDTAPEPLDID
jgi:hypothetical protein